MNKNEQKKSRIKRARTLVCLAVVLLVVVGFSFNSGWGTLCAAGVGPIAVLCPLGALESLFASRFAFPQVAVACICMLVIVGFIGRAFCAWICPVPPIQRLFHRANNENSAHSMRSNVPETCRRCSTKTHVIRLAGKIDARYAVLAGALVSSAVFGFPVFCLVCPVGLVFATLVALWHAAVNHVLTWTLLAFPAVLLVELVVFRRWCHALCPMGALMSLVGSKSLIGKPCVDREKCLRVRGSDCLACANACPEGLDPHRADSAECTRCGLCAEHCPACAIRLKVLPCRAKSLPSDGDVRVSE